MSDAQTIINKRADAILAKAEECFDLAKTQHEAADVQHQIAARLDDIAKRQHLNADAQHEVATAQRKTADYLDASANELDVLGRAITADAVEAANATNPITGPITSPELLVKMERVRH